MKSCPFRNGNCWGAKCEFYSTFADECIIVAFIYDALNRKTDKSEAQ